jgi:Rhodopirellula transposase DDE domain
MAQFDTAKFDPGLIAGIRQAARQLTLERHWNGTQLKTIHDAVKWASSMTWKAVTPVLEFIDKVYCKGVTLTKQAFRKLNQLLRRQAGIEKWSVIIEPQLSNSTP